MELKNNKLYFDETELLGNQLWSPIHVTAQSADVISAMVGEARVRIDQERAECDVLDHRSQVELLEAVGIQKRRESVAYHIRGLLSEDALVADFAAKLSRGL